MNDDDDDDTFFGRIGCSFMMVLVSAVLAAAIAAGCKRTPAPPTPTSRPAPSTPAVTMTETPAPGSESAAPAPEPDPRVARFAGWTAPKPATWQWYPPETTMRAANWVIPAPGGGDQAHLAVFQGIGGSAEMNAQRWAGQFRTPAGEPVEAKIERTTIAGRPDLPVMRVELAGEYKRTNAGSHVPDQLLLAAIIEEPEGSIHLMLSGDTATVEAQRATFEAFLSGMKRDGE